MDVTVDALGTALGNVLRAGLPVRPDAVSELLLEHRGVIARAVKPDDFYSRLDSLNDLLKRLIRRWPHDRERPAMAALYGLERGYQGAILTRRRERAAEHLAYDATHFRKQIEGKLVRQFAVLLYQDHLRYSARTKYAPPPFESSGDTPVLGPGDYTEQEELVSRIWSEVYALRAEIIAGARHKAAGERKDLVEARGNILWRTARLLTLVQTYLERYGERIMHGDTEFRVEGLIRLAGWRGGISDEEAKRLRLALARVTWDDRPAFLEALIQSSSRFAETLESIGGA